jgi:predicted Zn-dependent protease
MIERTIMRISVSISLLCLLALSAMAQDDSVDGLISAGEAAARKADHTTALAKYDAAIAKDAKAHRAHALRAVSLMATRDLDAADKAITTAIALHDTNYKYHELLGQLRIGQGKVDEGKSLYDKAAKMSPENAGAVYMDLAAALAQRDPTKHAAEIETALKQSASANPPHLDALFTLGESYVNAGRKEARDYLQRYLTESAKLPKERQDARKMQLARQLIRAIDIVKGNP